MADGLTEPMPAALAYLRVVGDEAPATVTKHSWVPCPWAASLSRGACGRNRRPPEGGHETWAHTGDYRPVDPKPPEPRAVAESSGTSERTARSTRATTSCAMRSPRRTVNGWGEKLIRMTCSSPR
jgi:hypothetical protein